MKSLKLTSNLKSSLLKNFNSFSNLTVGSSNAALPKANFGDKIKDKEQAEERFYFDKEESNKK